jgi:thiamine-phosphate pyrophosphorylase
VSLVDGLVAVGVRWFQLRAKTASTRETLRLATQLATRARASGAALVVNDRVDLALAAGASGVHLGQDDLPAPLAREMGPDLLVGVSTHGVEQARRAEREGADYVAVGSIYSTASKAAFELVGLETLRAVRAAVTTPLVAIGGLTVDRVAEVVTAGADGLAVISAVAAAPDPAEAAARFLAAIQASRGASA